MTCSNMDKEYRKKITEAVQVAIMDASMDKETNAIIMMSGEIIDALITVIAFQMSASPSCATPQATKHYAQLFSKKLRNRVAALQDELKGKKA